MLPSGSQTPWASGQVLSRLNRTAHLLAVYASWPGLPRGLPRKTRYRPAGWALAGQDSHPLGSTLDFQAESDSPSCRSRLLLAHLTLT
jgi:hypothetical protein